MDYQKMWECLKQWLEEAVDEGYKRGFNEEHETRCGGLFYAYNRTLEEMKIKEGEMNASN